MSRATAVLILTHGYPLFIALHWVFADDCRMCQVMVAVAPLLFFGTLFMILKNSRTKLNLKERFNIGYLVYMMLSIAGYYCICIFKTPTWVYDTNFQAALFLGLTIIFYSLFYKKIPNSEY